MAINIKRAKVFKLHEDLVGSDRDFICMPINMTILLWLQISRYIKVFNKNYPWSSEYKVGYWTKLVNNSSTKPIKKLNGRIKLFNE